MRVSKEELVAVLAQFNPWWRGEGIADLPKWRRAAFRELYAWLTAPPAPRAVMLSGARQIGKTTLMLQAADALLRAGVPAANILYATFDHPILKLAGIDAVIDAWREREPRAEGPEYLLLDEVDSLLRDRGQAQRSWELTQVNELQQQMERFHGIFIAATNLMTQLDTAALRRFDFKLEFRPLSEAQRLSLFAREAIDAIPAPLARRLASMNTLTPGDFANVVRQRTLLGEALSAEEFLRRLIVECRHKGGLQAAA